MKDPFKDPENSTDMPAGYCPDCGSRHDVAVDTSGQGHRPSPGDLSICLECGCLCQYGVRFNLERFDQYDTLSDDERINLAKARRFVRERMN